MAEEEEVKEEAKEAPEEKGGGQKQPLVAVLLLLNMIGLGVVGFMQFQSHQKWANQPSIRDVVQAEIKMNTASEGEEEKQNPADKEGHLFPLDGFTANLAQGDGPRRFLRMNAVLKFNEGSKEDEFKSRKPQIRDTIISIINAKRPEDLLKKEGKQYLKEEIKSAINSFLIDGSVIDIYYINFQIN